MTILDSKLGDILGGEIAKEWNKKYFKHSKDTDFISGLRKWIKFMRHERAMTTGMGETYLPGMSKECRKVRAEALYLAESTLGLMAWEHGIDLRNTKDKGD